MNPLVLVAFLAAGAAAQGYGSQPAVVRVEQGSYSQPQPLAYSAPLRQDSYQSSYGNNMPARQIPILKFTQEIRGGQSDSVNFETGNGIKSSFNTQVVRGRGGSFMDENGRMVQSDSSLEQSGHSYHEVEGRHISLTWSADENGFRATGDHLPQPVEMPAEHAAAHREALAIAAANPPQPESYSNSNSYSAPAQPALVRVQSYNAPAPALRGGY